MILALNIRIFEFLKFHEIHENCQLQYEIIEKNWNLKPEKFILKAGLFVIWKIIVWILKLIKFQFKIRIFANNQ